jgi:hypothetical protein
MSKPQVSRQPIAPIGERVLEWVSEGEEGTRFRTEHYRSVDSLGILLRAGAINTAMHDAGQEFGRRFARANLSPTAVATFERIGSGRKAGAPGAGSVTERAAYARKDVGEALDALGGRSSPAGSAVWFVAGVGVSVREWSMRWGWNGRAINPQEARGILVGALGVLAVHYRYANA